jgi:hypothetical protein
MCSRFVTSICHQPSNNDKLGLRASGSAQMFQYCEAILVGPVMKHSAQEENGDILLLRRLWVKEVVSFGSDVRVLPFDDARENCGTLEPHASRFKRTRQVLLPKL